MRQEFHPKRNQARQKLATLPMAKYKDLATDVMFEIENRCPAVINKGDKKILDNEQDLLSPRSEAANLLPPPPSQKPDDLNMESLDSLMNDLGQMLKTTSSAVNIVMPQSS